MSEETRTSDTELKRTPLYERHRDLGARLIEFGGWDMPVQYSGIVDEHRTVREGAGLFDISHMGEVMVWGNQAIEFLNWVLSNDLKRLEAGWGHYTLMCQDSGGVVDDLYVYRIEEDRFLLVINASRIEEDMAWLTNCRLNFTKGSDFQLENVSNDWGAVAIQGPRVAEFIDELVPVSGPGAAVPSGLRKNQLMTLAFQGEITYLCRTGYTGEDGFEWVMPSSGLVQAWDLLLKLGEKVELKPAGLGARDTLRTEVGYPLYGHELNLTTSPIEAGILFPLAFDKGDFIGREALLGQKTNGVSRKCVSFKMTTKGAPPRPGYGIWVSDVTDGPVGEVVSGTQSPSMGVGIGMGYLPKEFAMVGREIEVEVRGRRYPAIIAKRPLYRRPE